MYCSSGRASKSLPVLPLTPVPVQELPNRSKSIKLHSQSAKSLKSKVKRPKGRSCRPKEKLGQRDIHMVLNTCTQSYSYLSMHVSIDHALVAPIICQIRPSRSVVCKTTFVKYMLETKMHPNCTLQVFENALCKLDASWAGPRAILNGSRAASLHFCDTF